MASVNQVQSQCIRHRAKFSFDRLILSARTWHYGYKPFSTIGADTFMAVSSSQNVLYTCDPEATTQLFRDKAIGKPSELYKILNIFGPTMTGTDGQEARLYRTITAPFFNEYALRQVWSTSIMSTEKLLRILVKVDVSGCHQNLRQSLARMTLHILNKVCFENNQDCLDVLQLQEEISPGHELSYSEAMHCTLNHFDTIFGTPPFILSTLPKFSRCSDGTLKATRQFTFSSTQECAPSIQ